VHLKNRIGLISGAVVKVTAIATAIIIPISSTLSAQAIPPRTPWGAPDLQGIWNHGTATPLERPEEHAGQNQLTDAQIAEVNNTQRRADGANARRATWWERELSDGRTSMITDPPTGRIPYTAAATERLRGQQERLANNPEDRNLFERCISSGIPRLGGIYSQNIHIAQTPDHVLLLHEMIHEFRIIPLDGRPHLPTSVQQWLGDSRGRWEDDTLVVETVNFDAQQQFRGLSQRSVHLTERFTRIDADTLRYEVTFEDVTTWTQPWTATLLMPPTDGPMFEFACHEGNVGMTAVLETARFEETHRDDLR